MFIIVSYHFFEELILDCILLVGRKLAPHSLAHSFLSSRFFYNGLSFYSFGSLFNSAFNFSSFVLFSSLTGLILEFCELSEDDDREPELEDC